MRPKTCAYRFSGQSRCSGEQVSDALSQRPNLALIALLGLVARVLRGHDWFERVKSTLYRGPLIYKGFPDVKPAAT